MSSTLYLIILATALCIIAVILGLIRYGKLSEEYSLIWLTISFLILISTIFSNQIIDLYSFIKGEAGGGPEILLFGGVVFNVLFLILVSVKLSDLKNRSKTLTQQLALLKNKAYENYKELS
ncbi:MAG: DUF2304 domain-containing protein [Ekhidna sp.]